MLEQTTAFAPLVEEPIKGPQDYLETLRRRRFSIALVSAIIVALTLLIALLWPPTYRSAATVLIEEQDIPADLVRSTITSYAEQRLHTIKTRVMTRTNLLGIINKYNLYEDIRQKETTEETLERMRDDTNMETISAEVVDPRSGRPTVATIAFTLSYQGKNPSLTFKVANELVSLYLDENLKTRTEKAAQTSKFLANEGDRLSREISTLEEQLALFKEKHGDKLPEFKQLNFQLFERIEQEIMDTQNQIRALSDRKFYLDGQLAQINPQTPMFSSTGERILSPVDRLKVLETEYLELTSRYRQDHPDVVKMRREIETLKQTTGSVGSSAEQLKELTRLQSELSEKREKYKETHPDVANLKKNISAIHATLMNNKAPEKELLSRVDPENPAYITLNAQRDAVQHDLEAYKKRLIQQRNKKDQLETRLLQSPQVERDYLMLARDYENAILKYRELRAKRMEADIAQELERERKGERFSLIDPPAMPEKPVKPNRMAISFLGIIIALGLGIGQAFARDAMAGNVYTARDLDLLQGVPPLTSIPYYKTEEELTRQKSIRRVSTAVTTTLVLLGLLMIHIFSMPMDVLWYKVLRKLTVFF